MRCLNCRAVIDEDVESCPYCGYENGEINDNKEVEFELPVLNLKNDEEEVVEVIKEENDYSGFEKINLVELDDDNELELPNIKEEPLGDTKEYKFDFEQTRSIDTLTTTKQLDSLPSLLEDINKQIDLVNDEALELKEENSKKEKIIYPENPQLFEINEDDESNLERDYRKKYFGFALIGALAVLLIVFGFTSIIRKNSNLSEYDYQTKIKESLDEYYLDDNNDYSDIVLVLEKVAKDGEAILKVQEITKDKVTGWIDEYLEAEIVSGSDFEKETNNYKKKIEVLYDNAVYDEIRLLSLKDYNSYLNKIDKNYDESKAYVDAVDYYNDKSYNEAYSMFSKIDDEDKYYEKAQDFKNKIVSAIMKDITTDVNKISYKIDEKSDEEKLVVYSQIEDVLLKYDDLYYSIKLTNNTEYSELLKSYKDKVKEYSSIVSEPVDDITDDETDTDVDDNIGDDNTANEISDEIVNN